MLKKTIIICIITIFFNSLTCFAETNYNEYYDNTQSIENGDTYCTPKLTIKDKIRNAFIGQPTGFTPQIQPSPYLNPNYGPSYMQGYYSGNIWNSHNIYNPASPSILYGKSF